jgi:hypothetical protein
MDRRGADSTPRLGLRAQAAEAARPAACAAATVQLPSDSADKACIDLSRTQLLERALGSDCDGPGDPTRNPTSTTSQPEIGMQPGQIERGGR